MAEWEQVQQNPVAGRIREAAKRGTLSHALLLTGNGDLVETARFAAAAMECESEGRQPCGVCGACRKVLADIHPDVITVQDPEHKRIAVEIIRAMRSDVYIQPNEGRRKVYLFPDCSLLTEQDQNVLLKIVEEGPSYAAFLFCAENSAAVLQTLRSRCVELKLQAEKDRRSDEFTEMGAELCRVLAKCKRGEVVAFAARQERKKPDRSALITMLESSITICADALKLMYGQQTEGTESVLNLAKNLTKTQIMSTIEIVQKYHGEHVYNVGVGHVLGALAAELEGIL